MTNHSSEYQRSLRNRAEARLGQELPPRVDLTPEELRRVVHDLSVHQIELEIQNEELRAAQVRIERIREQFARLYQEAPVGFLTLDASGIIRQVNQTFADMIGVPAIEMLGKPLAQWVTPEDRPVFLARFNAFFKHPENKRIDVRMLRRKGAGFIAHLTGRIESDAASMLRSDSNQQLLLLTVHDVTELHDEKQGLIDREFRARKTIESILMPEGNVNSLGLADIIDVSALQAIVDDFHAVTNIGVAILDMDNTILVATGWQDICTQFHRVHPVTCKHCRESDESLSNDIAPGEYKLYKCKNNMWDMATPIMVADRQVGTLFLGQFIFDDETPDTELFRAQARRYGFDEKEYLAALDRVPRWSRELVASAMRFYTRLASLISQISLSNLKQARAVAELNRTQAELTHQEARLRKIFELLPVGLWFADDTGKLVSGNPAGVRIWGAEPHVPPAEYGVFKARRMDTGEEIAPDDWALARTLREGATITDEMLEIDAFDGEKRVILNYTAPVTSDTGKMLGAIVVNQDITALKRAEEERRQLDMQIQQTQKLESLGVLAGGIAHDFNNILMAVLGHADLAMDELSPLSPARENIKEIEIAARRAAELCRQMLAYAGRASFALELVNLGELIEEMTHLLKTTVSKKALLNVRIESNLPRVMVDASQIRQIIMNLIINASEAIGDRSGVISVFVGATRCDDEYLRKTELQDDLEAGTYVHIEVTDTGCGMDAETRQRLFEPFYTTKFTGRGLGMAAVLGIVRAHRGAIKVYTESGKGTAFKILLPVAENNGANEATASRADKNWRGEGLVLLVDDEESVRAVGAQLLERIGFTVITAEDGRDAVEVYRERWHEIQLVLLDLTMPHKNGEEAFRELRAINPEACIVLASGYSSDDVACRFVGKGLAAVLQKPYTLTNLRDTLAAVCG